MDSTGNYQHFDTSIIILAPVVAENSVPSNDTIYPGIPIPRCQLCPPLTAGLFGEITRKKLIEFGLVYFAYGKKIMKNFR